MKVDTKDLALAFNKLDGLIPAIIQDAKTYKILMLGFMNKNALDQTQRTGKVTFYSRTKKRLWTKGEESGNFLQVVSILVDCDHDALLIKANPMGPVCHTGADTCWEEENKEDSLQFLKILQHLIANRQAERPEKSYTSLLFNKGTRTITKKLGEEAIETIIGAMADDKGNLLYEAADLLYHLIVLLVHKNYRLEDLAKELKRRHISST
jgi:phosphoribosyl-ATP pyrophosphohydrolase/phosphoribosyl-AMP cyclohydrolase